MSDKAFHLEIEKAQLEGALTVILPGDPGRVAMIADLLENPKHIHSNREFNIMLGKLKNENVCVCSTGIGGPSTAIAIEELAMMGVKNFLRVGTTGAIQANINPGDLIISTGAVRMDGASKHIAPIEFPAVPDYKMVEKLVRSAQELGFTYHTGVTASSDTFYQGQNRVDSFNNGFVIKQFKDKIDELCHLNVLSFEMEAATVLTQTAAYGLNGACVLGVIVNRQVGETIEEESIVKAQADSIRAAVQSLRY